MADSPLHFSVSPTQATQTLAALLRLWLNGTSWSEVRRLVAARRVRIGDSLCLDPARRLKEGDRVEVLAQPERPPLPRDPLTLRHVDHHLVVVEKPSGVATVRHPAERSWPKQRKDLEPTLDELVHKQLGKNLPRLRIVHRLDKETSGLVVFARTVVAESGLGKQFHAHTVTRRYLAVVPGQIEAQRIASRLVRDRGDGRRGGTNNPGLGKEAVTHVTVVERLNGYTLLACRLETGRTHQIRIHLAELGHPVCGEKVYQNQPGRTVVPDESGAPRLALHATELGFDHPVTGEALHWDMPLPADLARFVDRLRAKA